ncbi:MAG: FAD-binding oxidoreductase [Balneolaceae bacterium]|nr:FAD-binding oxidoreductase [Balneolaceae bacterium]
MTNQSYWEKEAFPQQYDLIIVGAGITGLSTALFYKRLHPDVSVLVLERGATPQGASTRNAGFGCIGSISEHQADLERTSEREVKDRIRRRYEGLKLLKATLGESSIEYQRCGGYELFTADNLFEESANDIPKFNKWLSDLIGEKQVYSSTELNGYPVIHNRLEGALHPGKMIKVLIKLVQHEDIDIRWKVRWIPLMGRALSILVMALCWEVARFLLLQMDSPAAFCPTCR